MTHTRYPAHSDRVAIVHFTSSPSVGGVESLIDLQCAALLEAGSCVRLIVGAGEAPAGVELVWIPELMPAHEEVMAAAATLNGGLPSRDHPLVRTIQFRLGRALHGCHQCWIQNAVTVYLNPFLTVALMEAARSVRDMYWLIWCHDLSDVSAYWHGPRGQDWLRENMPNAVLVTISEARRRELATLLSLPESAINVIQPPIDAERLLQIGAAGRRVITDLDLESREPVVLVPLKLAPHKGLDTAVMLAACLRARAARPLVLLTGASSPHEASASADTCNRLHRLSHELGASDSFCVASDLLNAEPDWRTVRDLMLVSDLVFLPSREEGFGLPVREAAALRVPVLCSDIPAFKEAGGESARYFALDADIDSIASQVLESARSPANTARRAALRSRSLFKKQIEHLARDGSGSKSRATRRPCALRSSDIRRHDT